MSESVCPVVREVDAAEALPIVVGASLRAETTDRVTAERLREAIEDAWRRGRGRDGDPGGRPIPVVCTDLWYLNDAVLRQRPTITVGSPEVNAATAYLGSRVPTALLVEEVFRIQLDPELVDLDVCIWGVEPARTAEAVECFIDRYLDEYVASLPPVSPGPP